MLSDAEQQTLAYYNQNAEAWAAKRKKTTEPSFWHQEYQELKALKSSGKLLEIGSGSGREAIEFMNLGYEYVGIDNAENLLRIAQQTNPSIQFHHASVYDLPFEAKTFDAFSSWALLPHVPKHRLPDALSSIKRVLKPGGVGFLGMREGTGERQEPETGRWFSYYSSDELGQILCAQGFQIEKNGKKPSRPDLIWLTFFVSNT